MPAPGFHKKALLVGAFFILACLSKAGFALCASDHYDETVTVAYVYDGDTVRLTDGRKIRLIGINSPEVAKQDTPGEPYAQQARLFLRKLAKQSPHWQVRWGLQRHDHYGRWLGHVFSKDKNLNAELVRAGMASVIAIPPNQWALSCYQAQEKSARQENRGIWSSNGIKLWQAAEELPLSLRGFHLVQGKVTKIISTRKSLWLVLSPAFSVRIARSDLPYFEQHNPYHWDQRRIEVRGWLHYHRGRLQTRARHPASIRVID
jgi:endonuclease YncB( thermonuclease family)